MVRRFERRSFLKRVAAVLGGAVAATASSEVDVLKVENAKLPVKKVGAVVAKQAGPSEYFAIASRIGM